MDKPIHIIKCKHCKTKLHISPAAVSGNYRPPLPNTAHCPNKKCGKWYDTTQEVQ